MMFRTLDGDVAGWQLEMKVAVAQAAAVMFDTAATMVRVEGFCRRRRGWSAAEVPMFRESDD